MSRKAFISHASEDARIATALCAFLEGAGVPCWIAPRDVTPGREYAEEILDGIEGCAVFVLLLSAQANRSPFVRRELERAASKDKPLFLVRIEEVQPDRSLELFVSSEHWIDAWAPPLETHWARLANAIRGERAVAPPVQAARRPSAATKMVGLGAGLGVLMSLLAVGVWSWLTPAHEEAGGSTSAAQPSATLVTPAGPLVATATGPAALPAGSAAPEASAAAADDGAEPCPGYYAINPQLPSPYACTCGTVVSSQGSVWGSDIYTADSALCKAAVHAGVIPRSGGRVVVERVDGRELYVGTSRNGIGTSDYGPYHPAIHFVGSAQPAQPEPCPTFLAINPNLATPHVCRCAAGDTLQGSVWGSDPYTADSRLCRAAVHAGRIGTEGGTVTVVYADGRAMYSGSERNGVRSSDYGAYPLSIRFQ